MISLKYKYIIYGKEKKLKVKFKPMDLKKGIFVVNKMYASMLNENEAKKQCDYMNKNNPDLVFEIRSLK